MFNGILLVNKPKGITSNKVVLNLKKKLNISKLGHTGILDFSASGLLIILVGKATRLAEYLQKVDKEYIAVGKLGEFKDTYDISGKTIYRKDCYRYYSSINSAIHSFKGGYEQLPPPYSSKKVKGVRAYKLAKKGKTPNLKAVDVSIYNIEILEIPLPFFKFKVFCSSGTYIRSLIKDIGDKLNCGAYMHSLIRTKVGNFSLEDAIEYKDLISMDREEILNLLLPMEKSINFLPSIHLSDLDVKKFKYGGRIQLQNKKLEVNDKQILVKVLDKKNNFIGIGKIKNNLLKPEKVLV